MTRTLAKPLQLLVPGEVTYFSPTSNREITQVMDVPVTGPGVPAIELSDESTCRRVIGEQVIFDRIRLREVTVPLFARSNRGLLGEPASGKEAGQSASTVHSSGEDSGDEERQVLASARHHK